LLPEHQWSFKFLFRSEEYHRPALLQAATTQDEREMVNEKVFPAAKMRLLFYLLVQFPSVSFFLRRPAFPKQTSDVFWEGCPLWKAIKSFPLSRQKGIAMIRLVTILLCVVVLVVGMVTEATLLTFTGQKELAVAVLAILLATVAVVVPTILTEEPKRMWGLGFAPGWRFRVDAENRALYLPRPW
jgi:hypothetical protein